VKKPASIISNVVRAVDSGLVNTSQKEGWTKGGWWIPFTLTSPFSGYTGYILVYRSCLTYVAYSSYPKVDG
jgi:hypothetical protein